MDAPCCVGVARDSDGLVGSEITVGKKVKAYYASPKFKSGKRMGVVVVHDIFGFNLPNCKYICDYLAMKGYDAVMPNFYETGGIDAWPATERDVSKPLEGDEFGKFWGSITSDDYWENFKTEVEDSTAFLRRKGCARFGIIGFCWGGLAAEVAAKGGRFAAAISAHGCAHSAETFKEVKGNMLYISVDGDQFFNKESQDAIRAAGGKVSVFEGMSHGFVVRGDFSDAKVKEAADKAMEEAADVFYHACLRKPKYSKIAGLNPGSTNVTCLVKAVGDVKAVEGGKFWEVSVGDETAKVTLSMTEAQKEGVADGKVMILRNGHVKMLKGYMRLVVDKWGKVDKETAEEEVPEVSTDGTDLSAMEYELVTQP